MGKGRSRLHRGLVAENRRPVPAGSHCGSYGLYILIYCYNYPALACLLSHEGPMSQRCFCWIMQSSLWPCLSSRALKLKSSTSAVLVCWPFQIALFIREQMQLWLWAGAESKTERTPFEKLCVLCSQPPSQWARWYCLLCWHGICSFPPRPLTDNRSPLAGPPRANHNLLPVSHAEPGGRR